MQEVSTDLLAMIDGGINLTPNDITWDWAQVYEVYAATDTPPFDPADAVAYFSDIEATWDGNEYLSYVKDRGTIERSVDDDFNNVSINFSNVSRYMASLFNDDTLHEGQHVVIKLVSRSITDSFIVLYTGRLDNPGDADEETIPLPTKQHGSVDYEVPKYEFTEDDPEGRLPNDPLYEGYQFVAQAGTFDVTTTTVTPSTSFIGRLLGKKKKKTTTEHRQYSSQDGTPYGDSVPIIFGNCQVELIPINYFDNGIGLNMLGVACKGRIFEFNNVRNITPGFSQPDNVTKHYGEEGGVGSNAAPDPLFPNSGVFSRTAYMGLGVTGSSPDVEDAAPTIVAVVQGLADIPIPDADGVFSITDWTDNPAYIVRYILTHSDFIGLPTGFIDDEVCWQTGKLCDRPLLDTSNGDRVFIPNDQTGNVGVTFNRFHSTGRLFSWYYYRKINPYSDIDLSMYLDQFTTFDPEDPPQLLAPLVNLVRRYTCNVTLTDKVKVVDFLFNTILPSFRGFITIGSNGKIQIRTEQPADSALVTSSTTIGATSIPIQDVAAWKLSTAGKALIGTGLITSEVRAIDSVTYSGAGNSIPITKSVTGTITATLSSATLTGGTSSVAPSATVTIGGTITANDQVLVTIDDIPSLYLITATDTTGTVAGVLADTINANTILNRYVEAVWVTTSPNVITVKSKLGTLVFTDPLVNAHTGPRANPAAAPVATSSAGTLGAGVYLLGYTEVTILGETTLSPTQSITLAADKQLDVPLMALPVGVTARNWYLSTAPDSTVLASVYTDLVGAAFAITSLPLSTAAPTPAWNTTGEEVIRIAHAFDASNIVTKSFKWPLRGNQTSYNQFTMKFRDAAHDFGEATYTLRSKPHIAKVSKVNNLDMDGSAVDNWNQAVRLVKSRASKEFDGAPAVGKPTYFFSWTSRGRALLLEEGDVVALTDDTGGFINVPARIEKVTIDNNLNVTFTARAYVTSMFKDDVEPRNILLPSSFTPRAPSDVLVLTLTGGSYTLSPTEAQHDIIEVRGTLVSNLTIYIPTNREITFINNTTGAFTLTVEVMP